MDSIERVLRTLEGKPVDRVPTFCAGMEDRTYNEVLGKPLISTEAIMKNPLAKFALDKWGPVISNSFFRPVVRDTMEKRTKASVELGFDAVWSILDETFIVLDHKTMARFNGSIYNLQPDGFGNMTYMYRSPAFKKPEDFDAWPYWPDTDAVAHSAYTFFKKMMSKYGSRACLFGQGPAYGIQETILFSLGFEKMPLWIRREKDLIKRFIARNEELCFKTNMAILDAGVPVILQTDDFAFKSGPLMNPKLIDELFGEPYKRIIKAVHDRGAKYVLHSCGDNTLLFDTFISWGVDGLHAYEMTSNVDIFKEKRLHGDRVTIIGGLGVDYLLTDRSKDEEVAAEVKRLISGLGPGGRFILSPVHSLSTIPASKLRVMLNAARTYGAYPISVS